MAGLRGEACKVWGKGMAGKMRQNKDGHENGIWMACKMAHNNMEISIIKK